MYLQKYWEHDTSLQYIKFSWPWEYDKLVVIITTIQHYGGNPSQLIALRIIKGNKNLNIGTEV